MRCRSGCQHASVIIARHRLPSLARRILLAVPARLCQGELPHHASLHHAVGTSNHESGRRCDWRKLHTTRSEAQPAREHERLEADTRQTSVAVCNHAFHHNPDVWGSDHNIFDPERWDDEATKQRSRLLMHFGLGPRQCIGKTVATANIYKLMSTLIKEFSFELADESEQRAAEAGEFRGTLPSMISVGISDLEAPLLVKVTERRM